MIISMGRNVFLLQNLVNDNFESMGIFFGGLKWNIVIPYDWCCLCLKTDLLFKSIFVSSVCAHVKVLAHHSTHVEVSG